MRIEILSDTEHKVRNRVGLVGKEFREQKNKEGLRITNLEFFNSSLLCKWN
jgi:hypothetical protein